MKEKPFSEQLRKAVQRCGKSRYRIGIETDIKLNQLSRFVKGESGLSLRNIDKLLVSIGGRLATDPPVPKRKRVVKKRK